MVWAAMERATTGAAGSLSRLSAFARANSTATLPLAPNLPAGDPRKDLKWFPRGGDNEGVDAANSGWSGTGFTTGSGPVMRLAVRMKGDETEAEDIIPGGQSGLTSSEHFADQAKLWLANKATPSELDPKDVAKNAKSREVFRP
jgi:acyl-homoserine lactone acylase PvdQ